MGNKKLNISNKESKESLLLKLEDLKKYTQNEIPFALIRKFAEATGAIFQEKKQRGKGSQERFYHPLLKDNPNYYGYMGIHIVHGGRSNPTVLKRNFVHYMYKPLKYILENS
ncbi:MAG: hypothetical protein JXB49_10315 [Bacteroidales bacterium]|nr:hypothetical protein [Bacteroidales bacterium]